MNRKRKIAHMNNSEKQSQKSSDIDVLSIIDQSVEGLLIASTDGIIIYCNKTAAEMHGYSPEEVQGKHISIFHTPDQMAILEEIHKKILRGESFEGELWHAHRDGTKFLALMHKCAYKDSQGKIVGIIGTAAKISPGKDISPSDYALLYEHAPIVYYTCLPDGVITNVNKKWTDLLGYTKDETVNKPFFNFISEDELEIARHLFEQAKSTAHGIQTSGYERKWVTKDGKIRICIHNNSFWRDNSGNIVMVYSTLLDITERKKIEQELRNTNMRLSNALVQLRREQDKLIQYERLVALGQMASGIVHDFNNVLMPIMGFSDFLVKNPQLLDNKEDVLQILKDIHSASQDAKHAVMRLREFYKPSEIGQRCVVPVIQILKGALSFAQPKWKDEMEGKGIKIKIIEEYNASPSVFVEEASIREVIVNLLLNSIDAMPNGGTITLRTYIDSNRAVIQISDTGIGMTPETLRRCFEPFYTTKGAHGTGMGLALAYATIRRYAGTIEATSELGKGTTMTIRLPLADAQHLPTEAIYAKTILKPPKQVLVIDDEIWSRDLLLAFLTNDGHMVDTAASGHEGLRKFETKNYDVVIVDRAMPDMNGDDVASAIKTKKPDVPVIFATGFGDIMKERGEMPPCVDYILSKPSTLDELREALCYVFKIH